MDRSLAERIREHTNLVMDQKEEEKRTKIKLKVKEILLNYVKQKAMKGEKLKDSSNEISLEGIDWDGLEGVEVSKGLQDLGFEVRHYPRYTAIFALEDVSGDAKQILMEYAETFTGFATREEKRAKDDCEQVIKKMMNAQYEVKGRNKIWVHFFSEITPKYVEFVKKYMQERGFTVIILDGKTEVWDISVI